jgi:O-antigen ligase
VSVGETDSSERPSAPTLVAAALAFGLPLLAAPFGLIAGYWSARELVLVLVAPLALPLLLSLIRRRDAAALPAAAFLLWAGIATALSPQPAMALWGQFATGTGLIFVAALVACWAWGRHLQDRTGLVATAVLGAAVVSALIGIGQVTMDLSRFGMGASEGRADGMTGNAVFLGAFLAGALWVAGTHLRGRPVRMGAVAFLCAAGIQLSGSRIALLAAVAVVVLLPLTLRPRALMIAAVVAGVAFATLLPTASSTSGGTERLAAGGSTRSRTEMWMTGLDAVAERPVVGIGPGLFQPATSARRTLAFVRSEGEGRYFFDAHNLVIEYAVTTGVVGVLLLAAWLVFSLRGLRLRSPLAGFALVTLATHLVQPQSVVLTPLTFLALGAAAKRDAAEIRPPARTASRPALIAGVVATGAIGLVVSAALCYGFFALDQARLDFRQSDGDAADRFLPDPWWQAKEQRARIAVLRAREANAPVFPAEARRLREQAARDAPGDPRPLLSLADTYLQVGDVSSAHATLLKVLDVDPWSVPALNAVGRELAPGHPHDAAVLLDRSLRVRPSQPEIRELRRSLGE